MYNIVKFVDGAGPDVDKKFYTNILRAQLSDAELLILMYNGATARGARFKPYIEAYELLDNMPRERVIYKEPMNSYDQKAFGPGP